jgi:hypothetical protein
MLAGYSRDMNHYTHLERSLLSGLPNEIDFAMNVSLLFSYEGRPEMSGTKGRRIVDCMLSCVGICKDGELYIFKSHRIILVELLVSSKVRLL